MTELTAGLAPELLSEAARALDLLPCQIKRRWQARVVGIALDTRLCTVLDLVFQLTRAAQKLMSSSVLRASVRLNLLSSFESAAMTGCEERTSCASKSAMLTTRGWMRRMIAVATWE